MIRTVALLGLVASASALFGLFENKPWNADLRVKFGINPLTWGSSAFYNVPRSSAEAEKQGWETATRPVRTYSSGYDALTLWVNPKKPNIGILVDDEGHTGGLQVAIPAKDLVTSYDLESQGFTTWTYTDATGEAAEYLTTSQFFVSEDEETRKTYDKTQVLQTDYVVVDGPNGVPYKLATNLKNIDSIWTKQACVPFMGQHYYYNMTTSLSCDEPIAHVFPLYHVKTSQLIGYGLMVFVEKELDFCERPTESDVKMIVPTAPQCVYDLVGSMGVSTLHVYFIDTPWLITC